MFVRWMCVALFLQCCLRLWLSSVVLISAERQGNTLIQCYRGDLVQAFITVRCLVCVGVATACCSVLRFGLGGCSAVLI